MNTVRARSFYNVVLRMYPDGFYQRFAQDMSADFRDGYAAARCDGVAAVVTFLARSYVDIATSLCHQWFNSDSFRVFATSVAAAISIWACATTVAAFEWAGGPATMWFFTQLGVALTSCAVVTIAIAHRSGPHPVARICGRTSV